MSKHTPGPLNVVQPEEWPFDIEIHNAQGKVVFSERREAYSTEQKSVADVMAAKGIYEENRPVIIPILESQLANAYLRAAAPDLLEALERLMIAADNLDPQCGIPIGYEELINASNAAQAAITKATQPVTKD